MSNSIKTLLNSCLHFTQRLIPQPCLLCGDGTRGTLLCPACEVDLPTLPKPCCPTCALPTPRGEVCGACLKRPPHFDATLAALAYGFPADILVQRLKFGGELAIAPYLAGRLLPAIPRNGLPDLLIPMPLHPRRLVERGFNQAAEIARPLARALGIPLDLTSCRRLHHVPPQAGLDLVERRRNVRRAFHCSGDLKGRRVALLDDVMTTGATLDELARTIKATGAQEVTAWVVARTLRP